MRVVTIACLKDNYAYLLLNRGSRAVVIDPSEAEPVLAALEREHAELGAIWLTHHHWDHVGGVEDLCARFPQVEVWASGYDQTHGRAPRQTHVVSTADRPIWGEQEVTILDVPGHTLGAVAYRVDGCLFTGDTLFLGGCGRLFEGTPAQMQASVAQLRALNPTVLVYPGHEYTVSNLSFGRSVEPNNDELATRLSNAQATRARGEVTVPGRLSEELATNVFMRWDCADVIAYARSHGAESERPADVFAAVRKAKDTF
jgi:hydroxyacylglutathione hydrolase